MNADVTYHASAWVLGIWSAVIASRQVTPYRAYFIAYAALQLAMAVGLLGSGPVVALLLVLMHTAFLPVALRYLQTPMGKRDRLVQAYVGALSIGLAFVVTLYFLVLVT